MSQPTEKEIQLWKTKAECWDKLGDKIAKFYADENGDMLPEEDGGDLCDIGETAAMAFGYL